MSWPKSDGLETTGLISDNHLIAYARIPLKNLVRKLIALIPARGTPGGVCELDADGKVPAGRLDKARAGGICELDGKGKVPAHRYDKPAAGNGLYIDDHDALAHRRSGVTAGELAPTDGAIGRMDIDEFGHVTHLSPASPVKAVRFVKVTTTRRVFQNSGSSK